MVPGADHDSQVATHITFGRTVRRHNHPAARPFNTQLASRLPLVASVAAGVLQEVRQRFEGTTEVYIETSYTRPKHRRSPV